MKTAAPLAALLALSLSACGYFKFNDTSTTLSGAEPPAASVVAETGKADGVIKAGKDMNGKAIKMKVGETLFVELESIPTAGYVWVVKAQPPFLDLGSETQRPTHPEVQNKPGFTGGNHFLGTNFTAAAAGTGKLELIETRPWETDEPPTDTWTLDITVTE